MQTFRGKRQLSLKQRRKIRAKVAGWLSAAKAKHAPHGVPQFKIDRAVAAKINVVRNAQTRGSRKFGWRDKKMRQNAASGMRIIIPQSVFGEPSFSRTMGLEKALRVLKRATKGQKKGSPRTGSSRTF
jgi:hypothetical protein